MSTPRISVIIPHYNDLDGLRRCLAALDAQTIGRDAFEVIIGDNNSPCGVAAVEAVADGRARVVVVTEKGAGPARNGAAALARGEILAFVDSDCVPDPGWLAGGVPRVRPGHFIGGRVFVIRPDGALNGAQALEMVIAFDNERYVKKKNFTGSGNLFVMRADFERVGGFRVGVSEDMEWSHRAIAKGLTIDYAPDAAVGHPPRDDYKALLRKTLRVERELFLFHKERPNGRARWMVRSLLLPGMMAVEAPRILRAPEIEGARAAALVTMVRIRAQRALAGVRQCLGFDL